MEHDHDPNLGLPDPDDPAAAHRARVLAALDAAREGRPRDARVLELAAGELLDALAAAVGCAPRGRTGGWLGRETDDSLRARVGTVLRRAPDAPTTGAAPVSRP